ncbi:VOC family protein [Streptomyces griseosporeus]|uniref:VOC family protein n=1 Tax=Streptomyces griseosporeus TaxID=1910 RepID=UPI00367DED42
MIDGVHVVLYTRDAEADRAFLRDVLGWPHVDAGNGWLIFRTPPAEVACHPADGEPSHELMLMCDDLTATVADLTGRGVEITGPTVEAPWGRLTGIRLPGGGEISLYEPRHPRP